MFKSCIVADLASGFSGTKYLSTTVPKRGFTLIELLIVIAILAAILFPVFAQARTKARQTTCLSNMKQIGLSLGCGTKAPGSVSQPGTGVAPKSVPRLFSLGRLPPKKPVPQL